MLLLKTVFGGLILATFLLSIAIILKNNQREECGSSLELPGEPIKAGTFHQIHFEDLPILQAEIQQTDTLLASLQSDPLDFLSHQPSNKTALKHLTEWEHRDLGKTSNQYLSLLRGYSNQLTHSRDISAKVNQHIDSYHACRNRTMHRSSQRVDQLISLLEELRRKVKLIKHSYLQNDQIRIERRQGINQDIKKNEEDIEGFKLKLAQVGAEMQKVQAHKTALDEANKQKSDIEAKLQELSQSSIQLSTSFDQAKRSNAHLESQIARLQGQLDSLLKHSNTQSNLDIHLKYDELGAIRQAKQGMINKLTKRLRNLKQLRKLSTDSQEISELDVKLQDLTKQLSLFISMAGNQIYYKEKEIEDSKLHADQIRILRSRIAQANDRLSDLSAIQAKMDAQKQSKASLEAQLNSLKTKIREMQSSRMVEQGFRQTNLQIELSAQLKQASNKLQQLKHKKQNVEQGMSAPDLTKYNLKIEETEKELAVSRVTNMRILECSKHLELANTLRDRLPQQKKLSALRKLWEQVRRQLGLIAAK